MLEALAVPQLQAITAAVVVPVAAAAAAELAIFA
jgi:hypothetical protein